MENLTSESTYGLGPHSAYIRRVDRALVARLQGATLMEPGAQI